MRHTGACVRRYYLTDKCFVVCRAAARNARPFRSFQAGAPRRFDNDTHGLGQSRRRRRRLGGAQATGHDGHRGRRGLGARRRGRR
ncbi:hypothetical protein DJ72_04815, partial [Halorubrum distributum]